MTIKQRQKILKYLNYYKGSIDGILGNGTIAAQMAYKRDFQNGNYDSEWTSADDKNLMDTMKDIQKRLNYFGNYGLVPDGYSGQKTTNATKKFQKSNKLKQDGIAGTKTRSLIFSLPVVDWTKSKIPKKYLDCGCGGKYCTGQNAAYSQKMYDIIIGALSYFGKDISQLRITSGIRCAKYNKQIGGVANSSGHLYGRATDFRIKGVSAKDLKAYCYKAGCRYCYILSSTYGTVHCDCK